MFAAVFVSMVVLIVALTFALHEVDPVVAATENAAFFADTRFVERGALVALLDEETGMRGYAGMRTATRSPV